MTFLKGWHFKYVSLLFLVAIHNLTVFYSKIIVRKFFVCIKKYYFCQIKKCLIKNKKK